MGEAENQIRVLLEEEEKCWIRSYLNNRSNTKVYCPTIWDGILCWPEVDAGKLHVTSCPVYIYGFNHKGYASKLCTESGSWWIRSDTNQSWTNYSLCSQDQKWDEGDQQQYYYDIILREHIPTIKVLSNVGYSVSLVSLLVAFFTLACIKRLRCPRNRLHLHLFASFILRALTSLLRDALLVAGLNPHATILFDGQGQPSFAREDRKAECKALTCLWQYTLLANYAWILMEGLYLHHLIFLAVFRDMAGGRLTPYIIMGWGLPVLVLAPWIFVRATLEDTLCWTTNKHQGYFWIIRAPITASILINFVIFINITRVLLLKMFLPLAPQVKKYKYRKWFKSTLVLVPLFGVHYALLLGISFGAQFSQKLEIGWLYADQLFASFQGAFVAFLYCFLNSEVRCEVSKLWNQRRNRENMRSQTSLFGTISLTYLSSNCGSTNNQIRTVAAADLQLDALNMTTVNVGHSVTKSLKTKKKKQKKKQDFQKRRPRAPSIASSDSDSL